MVRSRGLIWVVWMGLGLAVVIPTIAASLSPLLAWRNPVYITAGFAGIIALCLLLLQPLLAGGLLPGVSTARARRMHRWVGSGLTLSVVVHVGCLWVTSPPDVVDALLFRSPTPFSIWGVIAMWSVFSAACLVLFRKRSWLNARVWRSVHKGLAVVTVLGSVVHALKIEGTMETVSKYALCVLVVVFGAWVLLGLDKKYIKYRKRADAA